MHIKLTNITNEGKKPEEYRQLIVPLMKFTRNTAYPRWWECRVELHSWQFREEIVPAGAGGWLSVLVLWVWALGIAP